MSLLRADEPINKGIRIGEFSKLLGVVGSIWALQLDSLGFTPQFCDLLTNCMIL